MRAASSTTARPTSWRRGRGHIATCCAINAWMACPSPLRAPGALSTGGVILSRLVVVSNRVAPISEGEPTAGGLAAGVMDALKQKGGLWFGWSGEVIATGEPRPERPSLQRNV